MLFLCLLTALGLLYVWQQTEIFRIAYVGQKNVVVFEDLLDKNTVLRYNIGKRASLVRIGNKVCASSEFQMPDTYRLVKVYSNQGVKTLAGLPEKKNNLFSRFFEIKRQAEAQIIINP